MGKLLKNNETAVVREQFGFSSRPVCITRAAVEGPYTSKTKTSAVRIALAVVFVAAIVVVGLDLLIWRA